MYTNELQVGKDKKKTEENPDGSIFSFISIFCVFLGVIISILNLYTDSGSGWAAGNKALVVSFFIFFGFIFIGLLAGVYAKKIKENFIASTLGVSLNGGIIILSILLLFDLVG